MQRCPECGGDLVWGGDWETVAVGGVDDPVEMHFTCENCLGEFTATYRFLEISGKRSK
jgi:hypothetical protein